MSKTVSALYNLVGQFASRPDDSSLITSGTLFHHAAATPLSGLLINLELAAAHHGPPNPYLTSALKNAERLKQLFEFTRQGQIDSQTTFRAKTALTETLLFLDTKKTSVQQHLALSPQTQLQGNKFLFQEALLCALKNSLEAYHASTKLRLILLSASETQSEITISIADGGKGLGMWEKALVFADGFSTKPGNSGVGLTWIKRVVVNHFGGKISLQSKPGHGTTLTWQLPKFSQA